MVEVTATSASEAVGEECHIVARRPDGPRGNSSLTSEERDQYDNLILLCSDHHKIVDRNEAAFTVAKLREMRETHNRQIRATLDPKAASALEHDVQYAVIVDDWVKKANLDSWQAWTSGLVAAHPIIRRGILADLRVVHEWLHRRVWPGTKRRLEAALQNFRLVANDLNSVLDRSLEPHGPDELLIDTFYKHEWHTQEVYDDLAGQYDWIVYVIHDLTFELTRAANWVADVVRSDLDPLFRVDEGVLIIERDEGILNYTQWRTMYTADELADSPPYRGLRDFAVRRATRVPHYDEGVNEAALERVTPITFG